MIAGIALTIGYGIGGQRLLGRIRTSFTAPSTAADSSARLRELAHRRDCSDPRRPPRGWPQGRPGHRSRLRARRVPGSRERVN